MLLDLFFPKRSLSGEEGSFITPSEIIGIHTHPVRLSKKLLQVQGNTYLDQLVAAGQYDDSPLLKKAIQNFKYHRIRELGPNLALLVAVNMRGLLLDVPSDAVLCPVPLYWTREFFRGFNQAEVLARELSKLTPYNVQLLLKRRKPTGFQSHRNKPERLQAMHNAFLYTERYIVPKTVIIIDDLSTTGATLNACAKTLKNAGVKRVHGLVIAQG